jgi:hypothetical protein
MMSDSNYKEDSSVPYKDGSNNSNQPVAVLIVCEHCAGAGTPLPANVTVAEGAHTDTVATVAAGAPAAGVTASAGGRGGRHEHEGHECRCHGHRHGGSWMWSWIGEILPGGHQLGRSNYIISELEYMLKSVRNTIPILGAEWDLVASCHEMFHPTWDVLGTGWKKSTSSIGPGIQTSLPLSVRQRRSMS